MWCEFFVNIHATEVTILMYAYDVTVVNSGIILRKVCSYYNFNVWFKLAHNFYVHSQAFKHTLLGYLWVRTTHVSESDVFLSLYLFCSPNPYCIINWCSWSTGSTCLMFCWLVHSVSGQTRPPCLAPHTLSILLSVYSLASLHHKLGLLTQQHCPCQILLASACSWVCSQK